MFGEGVFFTNSDGIVDTGIGGGDDGGGNLTGGAGVNVGMLSKDMCCDDSSICTRRSNLFRQERSERIADSRRDCCCWY